LHVATQGQPTHAVLGVAFLLLPQREPGVEEEVELLHTHLEPARGQEVAQFVERHDEGQAQDELGGLGQDLHAGMRSRTTRRASASVATRAGRSGAASKGRVCNAYSTRSLISRKPIRSS